MSLPEDRIRLHAIVEGLVQGVGFRYFVLDTAGELELTGWVRNRWDGSVEVTAEGPRSGLEALLSALYHGPRNADVRGVQPEWLPASGEFSNFSLKRTE